jgi:hypothetical protein
MAYQVKDVSIYECEYRDASGKKHVDREVNVSVECTGDTLLAGTWDDHVRSYNVPDGTPEEIIKALGEKIKADEDSAKKERSLLGTLRNLPVRVPKDK